MTLFRIDKLVLCIEGMSLHNIKSGMDHAGDIYALYRICLPDFAEPTEVKCLREIVQSLGLGHLMISFSPRDGMTPPNIFEDAKIQILAKAKKDFSQHAIDMMRGEGDFSPS